MGSPDRDYYSYCLQADLKSAIKSLSKEGKSDSSKIRSLRKKMQARFIDQNEKSKIACKDLFVANIIRAYRQYYRMALLNSSQVDQYDKNLYDKLRSILIDNGNKYASRYSPEKIEKNLKDEIKERGYYSLFGSVTPFRSLLIWKKQYSKLYTVSLPEKKQKVEVVFMDNFIELSWMHYATFGKYYVGGWAKKDALFCVKQAYKVGTPYFRVHYLAHEAQHFADYKSFPKLQQADLEYRAKLTELALTKNPRKFILKLKAEAKNNRDLPHCFAAYKIISSLKLKKSSESLNTYATNLLSVHSRELKTLGSKTAKTALSHDT